MKPSSIFFYKYIAFLILLFPYNNNGFGQSHSPQKGTVFTNSYTPKEYEAGISNWHVEQDKRGIMYIANLSGLLEYDGVTWRLIDVNDGSFVRALSTDSLNRVFLSLKSGIGHLAVDHLGSTHFSQINIGKSKDQLKTIVDIIPSNNEMYFVSRTGVLKWDGTNYHTWISENGPINAPFVRNDKLTLYNEKLGLLDFTRENVQTISNQPQGIKTAVYNPLNSKSYLFNDVNGWIYEIDSNNIVNRISSESEKLLGDNNVIHSVITTPQNKSSEIILGTRRDGLVQIDEQGNLIQTIDNTNGLKKNSPITDLYVDTENGIWVPQLDGVTRIESSPWKYWENSHLNDAIIFDLAKFKDKLYFATTKGAYLYDEKTAFNDIPQIKSRMWSIVTTDDQVYMGGSNGVYTLIGDDISQINNTPLVSKIMLLKNDKIICCTTDNGIIQISLKEENFAETYSKSANGVSLSILEFDDNIWVSITPGGVYKLSKNGNKINTKRYTTKHGLPSITSIDLFKYKDMLLFGTSDGFYQLNPAPNNDSTDLFIPHNSLIKERVPIYYLTKDHLGNIWIATTDDNNQSSIEKLQLNPDSTFTRIIKPFKRLPNQTFTKIYPDPEEDGIIWIAGTEGLYRYDDNFVKDYDIPFNTLVRKVSTGDSLIFGGTYYDPSDTSQVPSILLDQPEAFKPTLAYEYNQLTFEYAATSYEVPEKNEYSYWLEGNDETWSAWSKETKKEYTNLAAGKYTFHVKSKNVYDTEGRMATYQFTISSPWWQTAWAYVGYAILGGLSIWMIVLVYTYRIRVQRRKLKLIVADRTYEVLSQKKEIEKQHHELLEKTEEIKLQSEALSEKNAELESQQEEILTINHQLNELNNHLESEVENRTKKIKSTLIKLRKTNKELDTFIYRASHDLKSPISRIIGLTSLAKLEIPDDANREYFELIEQASNDMKLLLGKLTQLHEIVNKNVDKKQIDIPYLLGSVRESVKHLDKGKQTRYSFNIKDNLKLMSDEDILTVIVENLVENALIFRKAPDEEHHVKVEVLKAENNIIIKIWDNGVGIELEHQNQLFEMFFRASDQSKGSGLGLYLVKMAAEKLNGTVKVNSEPNAFTEFTVSLPN